MTAMPQPPSPEDEQRREDLRYIAEVWRRVPNRTLAEAFGAGQLMTCLVWTAQGTWDIDAKAINRAPADQVRRIKEFFEEVFAPA